MINREEMAEFTGQVIDIFEDFLDDKGIVIHNPEREADDEENSANIYGNDYGYLQSRITELTENWKLTTEEPNDDNTKKYCVLMWNDEYMQQKLIALNLKEDSAIVCMRMATTSRLVALGIANAHEEANELYDAALGATLETESNALHVSDDEVTIRYGSGYEERLQIVEQQG